MKAKTAEFLYQLLWFCEALQRPTWRNLTDSFETWAYRTGLHRQLLRLEQLQLVERAPGGNDQRLYRLTEAGRVAALGGRDPEARWARPWDGHWRLVVFDVPLGQESARNRLRNYLREHGFGYLQNSVWITPDPLSHEQELLAGGAVNVESLILLEARPCAGESDAQIVTGAWNFPHINGCYSRHLQILSKRPKERLRTQATAHELERWSRLERAAWNDAMRADPLLPAALLPPDYLGRKAWKQRRATLARAAEQSRAFCGLAAT